MVYARRALCGNTGNAVVKAVVAVILGLVRYFGVVLLSDGNVNGKERYLVTYLDTD